MKSLQVKELILLPKEAAKSQIQFCQVDSGRSQEVRNQETLCGQTNLITLSATTKTPSQKIMRQTSKLV